MLERKKIHISLMQLVLKGELDLDYFHQSSQRRFISICDDFSNSSNECKLICTEGGWWMDWREKKIRKTEKLPTFRWMVKRKSDCNGSFKRKGKKSNFSNRQKQRIVSNNCVAWMRRGLRFISALWNKWKGNPLNAKRGEGAFLFPPNR